MCTLEDVSRGDAGNAGSDHGAMFKPCKRPMGRLHDLIMPRFYKAQPGTWPGEAARPSPPWGGPPPLCIS